MPIYAYRCGACGHAKDVLQKLSDPTLTTCPSCGAEAFGKQVTAAGFQLKGSGWYVTDFRGGNTAAAPGAQPADGKPDGGTAGESKPKAEPGAAAPATSASPAAPATPSASPAAAAPAPSPGPAPSPRPSSDR
jgi:putative FmdB family regulatory protein